MARATQQRARKDYPAQGIKKGDSYWKWSFRFGGTFKSLTKPQPSQLTPGPLFVAGTLRCRRCSLLTDWDVSGW